MDMNMITNFAVLRKGEPMSDLIERQAVLDLCESKDPDYKVIHFKEDVECLPSVSTEKTRWIPVSERAPEFLEDVLMCDAGGDIAVGYFRQGEYVNGQKYTEWCVYGYDEDFRAVAWMPLPPSYQGESEEEK